MADVFTKKKRSRVMAAIRSRGNRETELRLATIMRAHAIKGWRRHEPLPGKPDFVFRRERLAIFVDGCFWHGCPRHGRNPSSNRSYWIPKLARNRARDRAVTKKLRKAGWNVLRFWDHDLSDPDSITSKVRQALRNYPHWHPAPSTGKTKPSK